MAKKNAGTKSKRAAKASPPPPNVSATGSASPMDMTLLDQITRLMRENDLNAIDVRDGDKRIIVKRGLPTQMMSIATPNYSQPAAASSSPASSTGAPAKVEQGNDEANFIPIKSPMVGTFYSASSPDAKPFVSVGSTIDDDTDVCVIEAMKVFNNIKAETRGTVAKILVANGSTVEFGQVLFLVKP